MRDATARRRPDSRRSPVPAVANGHPMNIGDAARATGVSAKMIRHYESIGLIRAPGRSPTGYRRYGRDDVHNLLFIRRARDLGFSIRQIADLLSLWHDRGRSSSRVKALCLAHIAEVDDRIRGLQTVRRALETLAAHCRGDDRPHCPILEGLSAAADAPLAGDPGGRRRSRRPMI
jgi:Cu(I)-responsive transcriptional regulator